MDPFHRLWEPRVPRSSKLVIALLMAYSTITSATIGFDRSMISATYIGGILAGLSFPIVVDRFSRRTTFLMAACTTICFMVLQAASVHISMLTVSRIGLGYGKSCTMIVTLVYLAETFPHKYKGWGLGLVNDFYYVGALIAAGVYTAPPISTLPAILPFVLEQIDQTFEGEKELVWSQLKIDEVDVDVETGSVKKKLPAEVTHSAE
ncbi:hypothetical protein FSARC_12406 [Fusarium sarcochroum]|uniref:Major facilitator superfamily (MFS) profile domain-containing protein n=1 Tax=Fusarium sarcochroum TaxID=1208366 RepID=A0A8H4T8J7_9HYPO|nr:hypothetical protein FSARC_12406 [Fusarium sarcochroum]